MKLKCQFMLTLAVIRIITVGLSTRSEAECESNCDCVCEAQVTFCSIFISTSSSPGFTTFPSDGGFEVIH